MLRISWQSFRYHIWSKLVYFLGITLAVAELFASIGLTNTMASGIEKSGFNRALISDGVFIFPIFFAVTAGIIFFSLCGYLTQRVQDFRILPLLGARNSRVFQLVSVEYGFGFVLSLVLGIGLGNICYHISMINISKMTGNQITYVPADKFVYKAAVGLSLVLVFIALYMFWFWMRHKGAEILFYGSEQQSCVQSKVKLLIMFIAGVALFIFALVIYRYVPTDWTLIVVYVCWSSGLVLAVYVILYRVIVYVEKRRKGKPSRLLMLSFFSSDFSANVKRSIVLVMILFFSLGALSEQIPRYLPVKPQPRYYNSIMMLTRENQKAGYDILQKYHGRYEVYPMVRITNCIGDQNIGISASVYKKLTGDRLSLRDSQVTICKQYQSASVRGVRIGVETQDPYQRTFFPGRYRSEAQLDKNMNNYRKPNYKYVYEIKNPRANRAIGQWQIDNLQDVELLFVFSNHKFSQMYETCSRKSDEPVYLVRVHFDRKYQNQAQEEVKKFAAQTYYKNPYHRYTAYTEKGADNQIVRYNLSGITIAAVCIIAMILAFLVMLIVFALADKRKYKTRIEFLNTMGMNGKEQKRLLRKQLKVVPYLALLLAVFSALLNHIFYSRFLYMVGEYNADPTGKKWMVCSLALLVVVFIIIEVYGWCYVKHLARKNRKADCNLQ